MTLTDQQALDLGRRAVACARWEWRPGMLCAHRCRVIADDETPLVVTEHRRALSDGGWVADDTPVVNEHGWPDLRDPATIGALLGLVREAWGQPGAACSPYRLMRYGLGWSICYLDDPGGLIKVFEIGRGATEAACLVAALEAAP
jgi:hypothetical protein